VKLADVTMDLEERVLHRVLRVRLAAKQAPRGGEHAGALAMDESLERIPLAATEGVDKSVGVRFMGRIEIVRRFPQFAVGGRDDVRELKSQNRVRTGCGVLCQHDFAKSDHHANTKDQYY
jgi:hypothetical protein